MQKINCTIRFITPAFLGDANGNAAWRTPPFKAELRHWWRIVVTSQGLDWENIRDHEAKLFGNAWPNDQQPKKSAIRMRLSKWQAGQLDRMPEMRKIQNGKAQVNAGLYSGYGEVAYDKSTKGVKLEHPPAIKPGDSASLSLGITTRGHCANAIPQALALMSRYGTVGGRSRNGWGSFVLESDDIPEVADQLAVINLRKALELDWARGIGVDEVGPLIWSTRTKRNWEDIMYELAQLRSDLNRRAGSSDERGLLSHPVTQKSVRGWNSQDRIPNTLRFKAIQTDGQFEGLIFHMPCQPIKELWDKHPLSKRQDGLLRFWQGIHQHLDNQYRERVTA